MVATSKKSLPLTPDHFIPLREAALLAGSKPNVLRKHRVAKWLAEGLAHKDPAGAWWVDPAVIPAIKPIRPRGLVPSGDPVPRHSGHSGDEVSPEEAHALLEAMDQDERPAVPEVTPTQSEGHAAVAVMNLAAMRPVPWELIAKLTQWARKNVRHG